MRFLLPTIVLAIAALAGWYQHRTHQRLLADIAAETPAVLHSRDLARENREWAKIQVDTRELERLRAEKLELLRWRGAIGDLRRASGASKGTMEEQIAGNREAAVVARQSADLLKARMEARDVSQETSTVISTLAAIARVVAVINDGVVPATWDAIRNRLERPWPPQPGKSAEQTEERRQALLEMFQSTAQRPIKPAMFELLPVPPKTFQNDQRAGEKVLLLREQTPRHLPDGGWARAYVFANGVVKEVQSADGNFSQWEKEAIQR